MNAKQVYCLRYIPSPACAFIIDVYGYFVHQRGLLGKISNSSSIYMPASKHELKAPD